MNSLPNSILLYGERGSEQEEICNYISNKFNLLMFDISDKIEKSLLDEISLSTNESLFIIDINKLSDKEQNLLLKFYEEPSKYIHIILLCENSSNILETLITRSYILNCDVYNSDILFSLCEKEHDLALKVCSTPGQIEVANHTNLKDLYDLCKKIFSMINTAPYYNVLSISNRINFNDEFDKFDLYLFLKMLNVVLLENFNNKLFIDFYRLFSKFNKYVWSMNDKTDGKKKYFENFLTNIYLLYRGC